MNVWKIFFSFQGRISRSVYWCATTVCILVSCMCVLVFVATIELTSLFAFLTSSLALMLFVLTFYCHFPIAIKRWHDRNKSGWWVLIDWIPIIGSFWAIIECGFLKGTDGPNRFGLSPLM
ncbi:DUF805 domain-containing protein [Candidatus Poribacteria bacterium]|nr:DUF805 domain-containing protein [Candidatus Poribacteria bacterium]